MSQLNNIQIIKKLFIWCIVLVVLIMLFIFHKPVINLIVAVWNWASEKNANVYLTIITAIYAFFTICIFSANKKSADLLQIQIDTQKEHWIKDSFIKRECEIIARAKDLFDKTEETICVFEGFFLSKFAFHVDQQMGVVPKFHDYKYYEERLRPLFVYYTNNQEIFDACGFKKGFDYLGKYMYLLTASKNAFEQDPDLTITKHYNGLDRALFWYAFPVLIHKLYKDGVIISNPDYEKCYKEFTPEIFDEYQKFLVDARRAIHSMRKIFDQIMIVDLRELTIPKDGVD